MKWMVATTLGAILAMSAAAGAQSAKGMDKGMDKPTKGGMADVTVSPTTVPLVIQSTSASVPICHERPSLSRATPPVAARLAPGVTAGLQAPPGCSAGRGTSPPRVDGRAGSSSAVIARQTRRPTTRPLRHSSAALPTGDRASPASLNAGERVRFGHTGTPVMGAEISQPAHT